LTMASNTGDEAMDDVMVKTEDPLSNLDDVDFEDEDTGGLEDEDGAPADDDDDADATGTGEDFNAFHELIQTSDPMLLWSLVRAKVVPHVPIWEFVRDKARNSEPEPEEGDESDPKDADYQARKLQTHRLKVMLEQLGEVVMEMGKMVSNCCIDADTPDPPKNPKLAKRKRKTDDQELVMSVNKTMNRVLHNKIPNTSGNGFKLKRDIPEQYSDVFHVEVPADEEPEDEADVGAEGEKEASSVCHYCDQKFKSRQSLAKHLKKHVPSLCVHCKEEFHFDPTSKYFPFERLEQHLRENSTCSEMSQAASKTLPAPAALFPCDQCGKQLQTLSALKTHQSIHKPTNCDACQRDIYFDPNQESNKQVQFRRHQKQCKGELGIKGAGRRMPTARACPSCGTVVQSSKELERHKQSKCPKQCPKCKKYFLGQGGLNKHKNKCTIIVIPRPPTPEFMTSKVQLQNMYKS